MGPLLKLFVLSSIRISPFVNQASIKIWICNNQLTFKQNHEHSRSNPTAIFWMSSMRAFWMEEWHHSVCERIRFFLWFHGLNNFKVITISVTYFVSINLCIYDHLKNQMCQRSWIRSTSLMNWWISYVWWQLSNFCEQYDDNESKWHMNIRNMYNQT